MIGWYVHHHGHGHLHRAQTVAARLAERGEEVTVLSSLPRPAGWSGAWVRLARDDAGRVVDPTAAGQLHWVRSGTPGCSPGRRPCPRGWPTTGRGWSSWTSP